MKKRGTHVEIVDGVEVRLETIAGSWITLAVRSTAGTEPTAWQEAKLKVGHKVVISLTVTPA